MDQSITSATSPLGIVVDCLASVKRLLSVWSVAQLSALHAQTRELTGPAIRCGTATRMGEGAVSAMPENGGPGS